MRRLTIAIALIIAFAAFNVEASAQNVSHPHLFFDRAGMDLLQSRVLSNPRLNKIWQQFKIERVDSSLKVNVSSGSISNLDRGRNYGDALGDLAVAYIVTRDYIYVIKALEIMTKLAAKPDWGHQLITAHISMGFAVAWDVFYDHISPGLKDQIRSTIRTNADNQVGNDPYTNVNWTTAAGEGLVGLAFAGDGDSTFDDFVRSLLNNAKNNFKESNRNVLWAHGSDGFPHQGLGYWRKYCHVGLFFKALRFNEPENDWFHLGKEYPGSEFLQNTGYPRIYADVQHPDLACLTWADSRQVRTLQRKSFGNVGVLTLVASEYKDGYAMDFIDYLFSQGAVRFHGEDWATFIFYDDTNVPSSSYRRLPLSRYWPDMEAAIFRSGWDKESMVFYLRSGSPGGHSRRLKSLPPGGHDHPDANGFVLFYNNDYLAAEDGSYPNVGPEKGGTDKITYGHNTFLIDDRGQKGDKTDEPSTTAADMDYLDAEHVGYLLGDATDAYENIQKFYRYVIYKKHKYFIILDELEDDSAHKYEFLLGTDTHHFITATGDNNFSVEPSNGSARLPVIFVEPREIQSAINKDRPYTIKTVLTDMLRVWPAQDRAKAAFFSLLYPRKKEEPLPSYTKIYDGDRSGIVVDGDEFYLYNKADAVYSFNQTVTDARLCYFKANSAEFEFLAAGAREFLYDGRKGIRSDVPLVAAFKKLSGQIRLGKNLGSSERATITLYYPGIIGVLIDGEPRSLLESGPGWAKFRLNPKQYKIGPSNAEQTVTDNYAVTILVDNFLKLTSPNGGEVLEVGDIQAIRWRTSGGFAGIRIEYSTDLGENWKLIAASAPDVGVFNWTVPRDLTVDGMMRIANAEDGLPYDISDGLFKIQLPSPKPHITSFAPVQGVIGTRVTVRGFNFIGTIDVAFNSVSVNSFVIQSDSILVVDVPAGATTGPIRLTNAFGSGFSGQPFTVILPPLITSFHPTEGPVGTVVTIQGENFIELSRVNFEDISASFTVISSREVRAIVPPNAATGRIFVINPAGTFISAEPFTVTTQPIEPIILKPTNDAYVMSSVPKENRGEENELRVRLHPTNHVFSFLKFQVANVTGPIRSAKIRLRVNLGGDSGGGIYSVSNRYRNSNTSWVESGLTWENAPSITGSPLSSVDTVAINDVVEFDVTPAISGNGTYSFAIKSEVVDLVRYDSRESPNPPTLVIELGAAPSTLPAIKSVSDNKSESSSLSSTIPEQFFISQNYPNPFNLETVIEYGLPQASPVRLLVYNLRGQVVRKLVDEFEAAGIQKVKWNGQNDQGQEVGSGIYFVRFEVGKQKFIRKILLQK
jgi:hypothetical protein